MGEKKKRRSSGISVKAKRDFAEATKKIRSLDLDIIKTFKVAASADSFHDAAKKLKTSQPRVSQRIKQLEEFLGRDKPLFDRDGRGRRLNALTPRGQELLVHAGKLIRMCDDIEDRFCDPSTVRGIVRIGVSESIVHTWLPALLKQVDAAYPNLDVEIEVSIAQAAGSPGRQEIEPRVPAQTGQRPDPAKPLAAQVPSGVHREQGDPATARTGHAGRHREPEPSDHHLRAQHPAL
jgi:DNA-binding transcriptional LysR family regulator